MADESFFVPTRGIGKPDYSQEVALGQVRPGLTLKYGQTLKVFGVSLSPLWSPYIWVKPLLAPGASIHLVDWETNLDMPFTVPVGYLYTIIEERNSFNQDWRARAYLGPPGIPPFFIANLGTQTAGQMNVFADVVPLSSSLFDPMALAAHVYDIILTNLGTADMEGALSIFAAMEELGTEPLRGANKLVKCKHCEYEWEVPQETTKVDCPKCGQLNMYISLANFRGF